MPKTMIIINLGWLCNDLFDYRFNGPLDKAHTRLAIQIDRTMMGVYYPLQMALRGECG